MTSSSERRFPSRYVDLPHGRPGPDRNWATQLPVGVAPVTPFDFRRGFTRHYGALQSVCAAHPLPGVAVVVASAVAICAVGWLGCKVGRINAAIIGRHHAADLCLSEDDSLSLRHLALIAHPLAAGRGVRFRLLDLQTPAAFADERGRRLGSLDAEGPAFVTFGSYGAFLLPTGDDLPWPSDPDAGWQCIPERIYFEDRPAGPGPRPSTPTPQPGLDRERDVRRTSVITTRAPVELRHLGADDDEPVGRLEVRSPRGLATAVIGATAADRGVLLGRYERCDVDAPLGLAHSRISRVHGLLLRIDGGVYLVDTASTNGLRAVGERELHRFGRGERDRVISLEADRRVDLGGVAELRWHALH